MPESKQYHLLLDEKLREGYQMDYRKYLDKALQLFRLSPLFYAGYTLILIASTYLSVVTETAGLLISVFVTPALSAGFFLVAKNSDSGNEITFNDFWQGFNFWLTLAIVSVVSGILVMLGVFLLVIPGLYLAVSYLMITPFIVLAGFEFWDAMEASRKLITRNFWNMLGFVLLLLALNIAGLLFLGIGVLVTIPISYLAIYAAFTDILPAEDNEEKKESADKPPQLDPSMFR